MSTRTIGEIAAVLGVIGSITYVVLWGKQIRAMRDLKEDLQKPRP